MILLPLIDIYIFANTGVDLKDLVRNILNSEFIKSYTIIDDHDD